MLYKIHENLRYNPSAPKLALKNMSDLNSTNTAFNPMSPAERYAKAISSGQFMPDEAQAQAVHE